MNTKTNFVVTAAFRSCLMINLGSETGGNDKICLGHHFCLVLRALRLILIEHCSLGRWLPTFFFYSLLVPWPCFFILFRLIQILLFTQWKLHCCEKASATTRTWPTPPSTSTTPSTWLSSLISYYHSNVFSSTACLRACVSSSSWACGTSRSSSHGTWRKTKLFKSSKSAMWHGKKPTALRPHPTHGCRSRCHSWASLGCCCSLFFVAASHVLAWKSKSELGKKTIFSIIITIVFFFFTDEAAAKH